jgi:hypothetical protein
MSRELASAGLVRYAIEFFEAAEKLRGEEEELCDAPVTYLYAHSIELSLKAYLVKHGASEPELRRIGHDLVECWNRAKQYGLESHLRSAGEISETLELLNPYYRQKEFEYISVGFKQIPKIIFLHNSAGTLLETIDIQVHAGRGRRQFQSRYSENT